MVSGHLGSWGCGQPEMPGVGGARGLWQAWKDMGLVFSG